MIAFKIDKMSQLKIVSKSSFKLKTELVNPEKPSSNNRAKATLTFMTSSTPTQNIKTTSL